MALQFTISCYDSKQEQIDTENVTMEMNKVVR